jgi:peptide/nickel transport system substrate-binding protein
MKLRLFLSLVAISCFLSALSAFAARRPRYGGILRVEIAAALNSFDPAVAAPTPEANTARDYIDALIYSHSAAGTGPFRMGEWEPGKQATLSANEDFAGGRPFVDSVELLMGRSVKDRFQDLQLGKTDLVELPSEAARIAATENIRLSISQPDELIALIFVPGRPLAEDARAREAIARSIDRASIVNFILQKQGEAAGGLLPQWCSGTAFLFSTSADPAGAKEQWSRIPASPKFLLGYDAGDALEQSVAERIVVNARDAGIVMTATTNPTSPSSGVKPDVRLIRTRMVSPEPRSALSGILGALATTAGIDASPLPDPASPGQIYERQRSIVSSYRVVPIVWLPQVYGLGSRVRNWKTPGPGESWPLADVWLDDSAPATSH